MNCEYWVLHNISTFICLIVGNPRFQSFHSLGYPQKQRLISKYNCIEFTRSKVAVIIISWGELEKRFETLMQFFSDESWLNLRFAISRSRAILTKVAQWLCKWNMKSNVIHPWLSLYKPEHKIHMVDTVTLNFAMEFRKSKLHLLPLMCVLLLLASRLKVGYILLFRYVDCHIFFILYLLYTSCWYAETINVRSVSEHHWFPR